MPLGRIERRRKLYDGGVCKGCGVRLDVTICRCDPQAHPKHNNVLESNSFTTDRDPGDEDALDGSKWQARWVGGYYFDPKKFRHYVT